MGRDLRWAAHYLYLEGHWRGRDRLVLDTGLESLLARGGLDDLPPSVAALIDGLVPARPRARGGCWMVVHDERHVTELARERSGAGFADLDEAASVADEENWDVALINLDGLVHADGALDPRVHALLEVVGERAEDGRIVVLTAPSPSAGGPSYESFTTLLDEHFHRAHLFGAADPQFVGFYDLGELYDADEDPTRDAAAFSIDDSLGPEPAEQAWVAIVGESPLPDPLTLVEMPSVEARAQEETNTITLDQPRAETEGPGARAQLVEARRRADLEAIERHKVAELLDEAQSRIATLEDEVAALQDGDDSILLSSDQARLDAVLAREQALRWELSALAEQLEAARARPVDELEAELARAREMLREQPGVEAPPAAKPAAKAAQAGCAAEAVQASAWAAAEARGMTPVRMRERLERLLRRIERGGMSTLELHRRLSELRRMLTP